MLVASFLEQDGERGVHFGIRFRSPGTKLLPAGPGLSASLTASSAEAGLDAYNEKAFTA